MASAQITLLNFKYMAKLKNSFRKSETKGNLLGKYHREGSTLKGSEKPITLIIGTRKQATIKKPKYYLLQKHSKGSFTYVSSLFPVDESTFSIDHKGVNYIASFSDNEVRINYLNQGRK